MGKEIQERAKFNKIRYANCWEDPELLIEAFDIQSNSIVVQILKECFFTN